MFAVPLIGREKIERGGGMLATWKNAAFGVVGGFLCLTSFFLISEPSLAADPPVYTTSFGPDGTAATDFDKVGSVAVDQQTGFVYVIDRAAGLLYKFDDSGQPVAFGGAAPYISGNQISGLSFFAGSNESQVAVNSNTHVIYVTSANSVRAFQANGEPAEFTAGSGAGTNELSGFGELIGVAVDADGNIYTSDFAGVIRIYAPSGEFLVQFETETPANIAVAPDGSVYVSRYQGTVLKFTPSEAHVTSSTTYTAAAEPLDENTSLTVAVDPATGNVYVAELYPGSFEFNQIRVYDSAGNFVASFGGPGEEGELAGQTAGVAVQASSGRVFAATDDSAGTRSQVEIFEPEAISVGPPSILGTFASEVTADSAALGALINPNTLETTYRFEYGTSDCASVPNPCASLPVGGAEIGSGHEAVAVSQHIAGLQAGTTYHYRVIAENSLGVTEGPDRTFVTQIVGLDFELSDARVWEMVSPPNKFGGVLRSFSAGAIQAAASGDGLAYQSLGSIDPAPEGNRAIEPSAVLARRSADGWHSEDITPPHTKATTIAGGSEYDLFSPELSRAVLEPRDATPLSPDASERTPYLRENSKPPFYTPLVTSKEGVANVPPGTEFGGDELHGQVSQVIVSGGSSDLSHVVLASKVPLVAGASSGGGGRSLYEWTGGQLLLVSVLPSEEGGAVVEGVLGSDQGSVRHAISEDGSRVFWSPGSIGTGSGGINLTALYVRDTIAGETRRLDVVQHGASGEGPSRPAFQAASADGTVVFFTDSQQLTEDASPTGRDLYRCEVAPSGADLGCASLIDVSAPLPGQGESAEVRGVVSAASDDGTKAYFVANAALSTNSNQAGEVAVPGEPNLYFWEEGQDPRFIVTLSEEDGPDWGEIGNEPPGYTRFLSATASPSGRYFAFMSRRSLMGSENHDATSGEAVEQVFRYDSSLDLVACVSCSPTGGSPTGQSDLPHGADVQGLWNGGLVSATLPEATVSAGDQLTRYDVYHPRTALDNGRVFFNAGDSLVPADSNGNWDVYQYEPIGLGSCSPASGGAAVSRSGAGCVSLISSGTGERAATFLDASTSGNDVFFLSPERLSVADEDTVYDIYDARVGGTPAVLEPDRACSGEACQPAPAAPGVAIPGSATFQGPGNLHPKVKRHCAKGKHKVRRAGKTRCVRKHPKHKAGRAHR
jgi:hypothetical protein